jgi:hypothetical protein
MDDEPSQSASMNPLEDSVGVSKNYTHDSDIRLRMMDIQRQNRNIMITLAVVGSIMAILVVIALFWSATTLQTVAKQQEQQLQSEQTTLAMTEKICDTDTLYLFEKYCNPTVAVTQQQLCFGLIFGVEKLIHLRYKKPIFDAINASEPQYLNPITYWAVDEDTLNEDSHLDAFTDDIVKTFNNTAYYYAQKVHMESVPCGGWSLSYWRNFPPNATVDLNLVYCEHVSPDTGEPSEETSKGLRVCGAFKLSTFVVL